MKVWTVQHYDFFDELIKNGYAYCKTNSETAKTYSDEYSWMIEQMKLHVGEPELKEIKRPIWGWCEFSTISEEEDEIEESLNESMDPSGTLNVLLEIDIPRERLLITNYYRWQDCLGGRVISTDIIFDGFYYNLLNVNKTLQNPQIEELCQRYKKKSWERIIYKNPDDIIEADKSQRTSKQVTFWLLNASEVRKAKLYSQLNENGVVDGEWHYSGDITKKLSMLSN